MTLRRHWLGGLKARAKLYLRLAGRAFNDDHLRQIALVREMDRVRERIRERTPRNVVLAGAKLFSQCDEDGILNAIFGVLGGPGSFIEIGCGNGLENNTHALLLRGWKGVWVDGSQDNVAFIAQAIGGARHQRLLVESMFMDRENVTESFVRYAQFLGTNEPDLLSMDIDGNDLHVLRAALEVVSPRVLCVEYNAKFPPPLSVAIDYDAGHLWSGDDYHGASLAAFVDSLAGRYSLLTCSIAGTNAFFVRDELRTKFEMYVAAELYQPPRYYLTELPSGHPPSLRWLRSSLR